MKKFIIFDAQRCDDNTHYYNFILKRQIEQINQFCLRIEDELLNIKIQIWGQLVSSMWGSIYSVLFFSDLDADIV